MKTKILCLVLLAVFCTPSYSDDWGCKVLLCLSNPKGPEDVEECVPPIQKLWRHLWWGGDFPGCDTNGDGNDDDNSTLLKVDVQRHYNDDDEIKWIKVYTNGKFTKEIRF